MENVSKYTFQILFVALSLFLVQRSAFGQMKARTTPKSDNDAPSYVKSNNIEIYPTSLIAGAILGGFALEVGYERLITPKTSLELKPSIASLSSSVNNQKFGVFAMGLRTNYLFYLSYDKEKHTGWYVGPGFDIGFGTASFEDKNGSLANVSATAFLFALNAIAGYQWIFRSGWVIDLGGGVSVGLTKVGIKGVPGVSDFNYGQGVSPIFKLGVGYNL